MPDNYPTSTDGPEWARAFFTQVGLRDAALERILGEWFVAFQEEVLDSDRILHKYDR